MSTGNLNDGLIAMKDGKMITLRVPYPLGFYAKGFDGRIDDPKAGWKGRGLWSATGDRSPWLNERGKGPSPWRCISRFAPIRWRNKPVVFGSRELDRGQLLTESLDCEGSVAFCGVKKLLQSTLPGRKN